MHGLRVQALTLSQGRHLARRFFGALGTHGPPGPDEAWVAAILVEGSATHCLWQRLSGADRRHAVGVARSVAADLGAVDATPAVLAAALLHDAGKVESGLGTLARVPATVAGLAGARGFAAAWAARPSGVRRRVGLYLNHPEVGAALLTAAGADPLTIAWTREHHLPASRWTLPPRVGAALKAADDD